MSRQRQKQVAQVMYLAGQMHPGQRTAFLKHACAGDKELYREVDSRLNTGAPSQSRRLAVVLGSSVLLAAVLAVSLLLQGADEGVPATAPNSSKRMADEFASSSHPVEPESLAPRPVIRHSITLATQPADAQISLDGTAVADCLTPCMMKVLPGQHTVTYSKAGYRTAIRRIEAPAVIPLVELEPISGVLFLQSEPPGATVVLDGIEQPYRAPVRLVLAPGSHRITLRHADREGSIVVDTADGEIRHLSVPVQ